MLANEESDQPAQSVGEDLSFEEAFEEAFRKIPLPTQGQMKSVWQGTAVREEFGE